MGPELAVAERPLSEQKEGKRGLGSRRVVGDQHLTRTLVEPPHLSPEGT